jgi:tetratricopeptide (TPR) repeat protein
MVESLERLFPDRLSEHAARLAHHAFRGEVWAKALGYLKQTATADSRSSLDAALMGSQTGALWWNGDYLRAIEVGQRDLAVAAGFKNFSLSVVSNLRLGQVHHALADYPRAADLFRRTIAALKGDLERERCGMAGLPSVYARAWLAWCLAELGDFQEGIAQGEEAVAIADSSDDAYSRGLAAWGLGTLHVVRGDAERAVTVLERGLAVTRMAGHAIIFPIVAAPLGRAYSLAGRVNDGMLMLEQALQQADSLSLVAHHALRLTWLGETLMLAGKIERAGESGAQALVLAERLGERGSQAYARRLAGELALLREPPDAAAALAAHRDALGLATELAMRPLAARCHLGLEKAHRRSGAAVEARAELETAARSFRNLGMSHWLGQVDVAGVAPG